MPCNHDHVLFHGMQSLPDGRTMALYNCQKCHSTICKTDGIAERDEFKKLCAVIFSRADDILAQFIIANGNGDLKQYFRNAVIAGYELAVMSNHNRYEEGKNNEEERADK